MLAFIVLLGLVTGSLSAVLCPTKVDSQQTVHLPHPTSCSKFLTCVGNHPVEQDCPAGLYWNIEQAFCDYPGVSGCSRGEHAQQLEKQLFNSTAVVNSICLPQFDRCPLNSNPSEQMIFVKHHDCRKFYACVQTHQVELSCPPNLYWNSNGCVCDYEVEAECVDMKRPNDEIPVVDEGPIEPENGEDQEPADEPDQSGDEDVEQDQEPEPEGQNKPDETDAHEPAEEPEQNVDEVPEGDGPVARVRRAVDGEDPSNGSASGGSSGSESGGSESSGSGSSGSESSGSGSSGSGSSEGGSSGSGSSGSGSSGGGSSGTPVESGADVGTVSSIAIIAFTAVMSLI